LSVAVAAVLLAGLALWGDIDPADVARTWGRLPARVYLLALAIHAAIFVLRALRLRVLIPPGLRPDMRRMLPISAAHTLAAYVLPAKTGEAALVVYLRALCGVPAAEGLATLLVARLVDLAALSGCMSAAAIVIGLRRARDGQALVSLGLLLAGVTLAFLALGARGDRLVRLATRAVRLARLDRTRLGARLVARAETLAGALTRAGAAGRLPAAVLLSVPLWVGVFLFYAVLARGLGLELDLFEATFGSGLSVLANMLPINGIAGFGTQEAGWVAGFAWLGVGREQALATGLGVHLVQLANACLFGLLGHLAMGLASRPAPEA
jgi:uncharacterized protein (TIRG00374 family)